MKSFPTGASFWEPTSSEVLLNALDRPLSRVLRDVASLINSSVDLDTTLQHLVDAACQHNFWSMAAVMSIDQADGAVISSGGFSFSC